MKNETVSRALLAISFLIVASVIVGGFLLIGSPAFNRKVAADRIRTEDLETLREAVESYYRKHQRLPQKIADAKSEINYYGGRWNEPEFEKLYDYRVLDQRSYELCTQFDLASSDSTLERPPYWYSYGHSEFLKLSAGRHCFRFDVDRWTK